MEGEASNAEVQLASNTTNVINDSLGSNYFNGPAGKGFLDAVNHSTKTIYDFKFGGAFMSNSQYLKYSNSFPGYRIQIIRP